MKQDEEGIDLIEQYHYKMLKEFEQELAEKAKLNEDWTREDEDKVDQEVYTMIFAFFISLILLFVISAFIIWII